MKKYSVQITKAALDDIESIYIIHRRETTISGKCYQAIQPLKRSNIKTGHIPRALQHSKYRF